jgi:AmmeMemoRadiSam system protein B
MFYPMDREELLRDIKKLVDSHSPVKDAPKAMIVPHAGYAYSAMVAAAAYAKLKGPKIKRIILIGPAHHAFIEGSVTSAMGWLTPLGVVKMRHFKGIPIDEDAFEEEHSLEVQLPFLQYLQPDAAIEPILVGDQNPEELAKIIGKSASDAVIIVSSDLSHYMSYDQAESTDERSIRSILDMKPDGFIDACGEIGIRALIIIAKKNKWKPTLLMAKNSGDTSGDKGRVVGYASIEFR